MRIFIHITMSNDMHIHICQLIQKKFGEKKKKKEIMNIDVVETREFGARNK